MSHLDPSRLAMPVADDPRCGTFVRELVHSRWHGGADPHIAAFAASAAGAIVIVAVHHGNFPSLEYMAATLRARGHRIVAIYLQGDAPGSTYDDVLVCDGSLARLAAAVAAVAPATIYVQAHGRWSFLGQFVAAVDPHLRVVQEVWDWMDAFVEPSHEAAFVEDRVFRPEEIAMARVSEAWVRTRSAAFVHKEGGSQLDAVVADARVPEVRIVPSPPRAWTRRPARSRTRTDTWRLVHAGQIKPSTSSRRVFGDLHVLPLFRALVQQELHVTAYAPAIGSGAALGDVLGEYCELAARDPRFRIEPRRPVDRLLDEIHGRHDFGLLLYPFDDDLVVGRRHLATALASKLFVYLAAGLPVLVSPELGYMAELVRTHGIGIVVPRADIPRLATLLAELDYASLLAAVERAQAEFCFERNLPALEAVLAPRSP